MLICRNNSGRREESYGLELDARRTRENGKDKQETKHTSRLRVPDVMKRVRPPSTAASGVVWHLDLVWWAGSMHAQMT